MNPYLFLIFTSALIYRALKRHSLTPPGILAAVLTASLHALHPWNAPFLLLISFYLLGTTATKVKHAEKAKLTLSSSGAAGGEGARTHVQVLANSIVASVLAVLHAAVLRSHGDTCWARGDVLMLGIVANYAAVTADTLGSELGILSKTPPLLITTLKRTPPGTNGGVSLFGLAAGAAGAAVIGVLSTALIPFCAEWTLASKLSFIGFTTVIGVFGSVLDSVLGATLQQSVVDVRAGKIVEAPGGEKVLVHPGMKLNTTGELRSRFGKAPQTAGEAVAGTEAVGEKRDEEGESRSVIAGWDLLSNNGVNVAMAVGSTVVAMWWWGGSEEVLGQVVGAGFAAWGFVKA